MSLSSIPLQPSTFSTPTSSLSGSPDALSFISVWAEACSAAQSDLSQRLNDSLYPFQSLPYPDTSSQPPNPLSPSLTTSVIARGRLTIPKKNLYLNLTLALLHASPPSNEVSPQQSKLPVINQHCLGIPGEEEFDF